MEDISVLSLSRIGIMTTEWSEIPDADSLSQLKLPIYLGALYDSEDKIANRKLIESSDDLKAYYAKLKHAYGSDTPIIAMSKYDTKNALKLIVDKNNFRLEGLDQNANVTDIANLEDILYKVRKNIVRDSGKVELGCILEDSNIRVVSTC